MNYPWIRLFFLLAACLQVNSSSAALTVDPVIYAAGDIARCSRRGGDYEMSSGAKQTAGQLVGLLGSDTENKHVLALGDLAYLTGTSEEFRGCYSQSWGRQEIKKRTYPAPGNHEYYGNADLEKGYNIEPYNDYWKDRFGEIEKMQGFSGEPELGYYKFQLGSWTIISLNSTVIVENYLSLEKFPRTYIRDKLIIDSEHYHALSRKLESELEKVETSFPGIIKRQRHWLSKTLNRNRACKLVFLHHPRYSSGKHGQRAAETEPLKELYELLYNKGVSVVLSGHDHHYERFYPMTHEHNANYSKGMRSFVVGTGGVDFRKLNPQKIHHNSEKWQDDKYGLLQLTLHDRSYTWQYLPAGEQTWAAHTESCVPRQ